MPWLVGTAFLHSVMVQEKRGMLRVWNVSLIVAAFALALLGTFLVRSGILQSIHAFGDSTVGGPLLGLIAVVVIGSAALIVSRLDALRGERRIESLASREYEVTAHDRVAERALRLIPADDVVSATNSLGGHLSERRRVLSFPVFRGAEWIAADETRPGYADRIAPLATSERLRRLRLDARWRIVFDEDGIVLFRRR